jgi:hypothetical protein
LKHKININKASSPLIYWIYLLSIFGLSIANAQLAIIQDDSIKSLLKEETYDLEKSWADTVDFENSSFYEKERIPLPEYVLDAIESIGLTVERILSSIIFDDNLTPATLRAFLKEKNGPIAVSLTKLFQTDELDRFYTRWTDPKDFHLAFATAVGSYFKKQYSQARHLKGETIFFPPALTLLFYKEKELFVLMTVPGVTAESYITRETIEVESTATSLWRRCLTVCFLFFLVVCHPNVSKVAPNLDKAEECCDLLHLQCPASTKEIHAAFRHMSKIYHPDKTAEPNHIEKYKRISECKTFLLSRTSYA